MERFEQTNASLQQDAIEVKQPQQHEFLLRENKIHQQHKNANAVTTPTILPLVLRMFFDDSLFYPNVSQLKAFPPSIACNMGF